MEPKMGKKIVSRGRYVAVQGKRLGLLFTVLCLASILIICFIGIYIAMVESHFSLEDLPLWGVVFGIGSVVLISPILQGIPKIFNAASQIDPGVPLSRANTADLPAPDSLVRSSAEPMQVQESVLLRAITEGEERHEEQLVRASLGQE